MDAKDLTMPSDMTAAEVGRPIAPADYVTLDLAAAITGYTKTAIIRKIDDGKWREGEVWVKAPDGRRLISLKGYNRWATQQR